MMTKEYIPIPTMLLFRNIKKVLPLAVHLLCCFGAVCSSSPVKCEFDLCDRGKQFCDVHNKICTPCEYTNDYCEMNTANSNDEKCLLYFCQENKIKILNESLMNYEDNVKNLTQEIYSLQVKLNATNRENFESNNLITKLQDELNATHQENFESNILTTKLEIQVDKLKHDNKTKTHIINWLIGAVVVPLSIICITMFIYLFKIKWMRTKGEVIRETTQTAPESGLLLAENLGGYEDKNTHVDDQLTDKSLHGNGWSNNQYTHSELQHLNLNDQKENTKLVCAESEASPSNYEHIQHDANTTPKSLFVKSKSAKGNQQPPISYQPLTPNAPCEYPGPSDNGRYQNQQWPSTQAQSTDQTPPPPQETPSSPPEIPIHVVNHINVNVNGLQNTGSDILLKDNNITQKFQTNDKVVDSNLPENDHVTENIDNQSDVNNPYRTGIGQDCNTDQRHVNTYLNAIRPSQQDQAQFYPNETEQIKIN